MLAARFGRTDFLIMLAVLALVYFAVSWAEAKSMPWAMLIGVAIGGVFPFRLHDLGASGWWATLPGGASLSCSVALRHEFLIFAALAGALFVGITIGLAILPGQPGANRFGPPPGRFFGLR